MPSLPGVRNPDHLPRFELRDVSDYLLAPGLVDVEVSQRCQVVRDWALAGVLHRVIELGLLQVNRGRCEVGSRLQPGPTAAFVLVPAATLPFNLDPDSTTLPLLQLWLTLR